MNPAEVTLLHAMLSFLSLLYFSVKILENRMDTLNGGSPFLRHKPPQWRGAWLLPHFEQIEEIVPFFTVTLGLSHAAENPLRSPGERGRWEAAARSAEAPLTQPPININTRRASDPRPIAPRGAGRGEGSVDGSQWQGVGRGQTPLSVWGRLSSGSVRTLGV